MSMSITISLEVSMQTKQTIRQIGGSSISKQSSQAGQLSTGRLPRLWFKTIADSPYATNDSQIQTLYPWNPNLQDAHTPGYFGPTSGAASPYSESIADECSSASQQPQPDRLGLIRLAD
ncbi:hypothetical protein D8B26_006987 [Coccidioides posadasii str. Silveira]|uniref:uncharacterized protein n=1 Tax=Coccidioides posadasii (strain RMSCC 757 / Silveira) TaxID=443226 RepID=UPI001BF0F465|nr:hypothetical protein D8B26_006987 [Coccidioides posadasii str. Silveira]